MTDIANIGFRADTTELKDAKQSLDALVPSATKAEKATEGLSADFDKLNTAAGRAARGAQGAKSGFEQAAQGAQRTGAGVAAASGVVDGLTGALGRLIGRLSGVGPAANSAKSNLDRLGAAANDNINRLQSTPGNIAAQFQDIGVTAAAGMSPMLIALQQGTQLSAAMQGGVKNLLAGITQLINPTTLLTIGFVGLVAALIQWVDWIEVAKSALNFLADAMVPIAPYAIGIAAALVLIYSPAIIAGIYSLITAFLGLAASMIATLGIPALIVLGLAAIIAAANVWRDDLTKIFGVDIVAAAKDGINQIIGGFVGAYNTIVEVWRNLPNALGDAAYQAANSVRDTLNGLFTLRDEKGNIRWQPFGGPMANPYSGALANVGAIAARNIGQARGVDYIGTGVQMVQGYASDAADYLRNLAAGLGSGESGAGSGSSAGAGRAGAHVKSNDELFAEVTSSADDQLRSMLDLNAQVGVYDEQLMRLKHEQELFNMAQDKGVKLTDDMTEELKRRAAEMASLEASTVHDQFIESQRKQHDDMMTQLQREQDQIGLTGAALAIYRYETEMLAAARAKNITLTPQELADLHALAVEYGNTTEEIRQQKEALDFAKGTVRGFFEDFLQNARESGDIFDAFADSVVKAIDRITDRMLDMALNQFMQPGGGGDFLANALNSFMMSFGGGAAKGAVFANGGAFTNSIVSEPTLFSYANGAAMGEMGEAGPEAIMPLTRGPDGSLGVQAHGSGGGTVVNAPVQIDQHFNIQGALSSQDILNMLKQSSEQTKRELSRELPAILSQYERDGAMS